MPITDQTTQLCESTENKKRKHPIIYVQYIYPPVDCHSGRNTFKHAWYLRRKSVNLGGVLSLTSFSVINIHYEGNLKIKVKT